MKNQFYLLLILIVSIVFNSCEKREQSQIKEYNETILTYPFSDTNPFPIISKKNDIYPYSRIDGYSHTGEQQEWKMVKLENEYVEVYILPELGGKVWGAIDKITGKEFIYKNDVVKFRDVAMRGPWTSGGIEWNSGVIGHHPGGAAMVNYKLFTDENGTAHCVVGGMDLPSHLQWRVDISLPVDKSYFETKTNWFNASPFHQSYYHWNNAAVKSADDLHFYFPGNYWLGHNGISHPWPVDEDGIDRSWYKNNTDNNSSSYHIFGSIDNYFVSYYHDEDFGSGHWSRSYGAPGKKIWLWSQARNGAIWEELLTDTHGQYVEVQAGRMFNQNSLGCGRTPFKQQNFVPYNSDCWTERWFPVRGTDGVSRVSKSGTINVKFDGKGMNLLFSPTSEINDKIVIIANGKELLSEQIILDASETLNKEFNGISDNDKIEIHLGTEKLYSTSDNFIIDRPAKSPVDALDNLFVLAVEQENRRAYKKALNTYFEVLQKEPLHLKAMERVAELYARSGEFDLAIRYAKNALEINAYLPGANFIYGYINKMRGNFTDAKDGFGWAMRSLEYRSASYQQLAEISLAENNFDLALEQAGQSLLFNKLNLNSYKIIAIAQRKMNQNKQAFETLNRLQKVDPLSHFVLFEKYLLKTETINAFNNSFKSEMLRDEYLELGLFYNRVGLHNEAIEVLEQAPQYTITNYWLAWLTKTDNSKSNSYLKKALDASPEFVFPYRNETLPVLAWAAKQSPAWITDYYSALILWNKNQNKKALNKLNKWENQPDFVPFYYSRAHLKGIGTNAGLEDMKKALLVNPNQWRTYNELADIYNRRGEFSSALGIAKKGYEKFKENYILGIAYGKSLTLNGKYEKSAEVLNSLNVLPYEGEKSAQNVYVYNYIMLAFENYKKGNFETALKLIDKSENYPENLGSGSPSYPDYRSQNSLRIKIYNKTGETQKAEKAQNLIQQQTKRFGKQKSGNLYEQSFADNNIRPF